MFIITAFLFLVAIAVPVAFALGLTSALFLWLRRTIPLIVIPQRMVGGANSFPLLAIPLFLLAGNIMNAGKLTHRLVEFASTLVGHITGGLAHVNVVTSMIMAGMTGSAVADTSAEGSVLIPAMSEAGYSKGFAAAITAASATIGPIIPPSIPMVVIASAADLSIGRLFLGGIVPGVLMGLYLMLASYLISRKRHYPRGPRPSLKLVAVAFWRAIPVLFLPVIILGGIMGGVFTPTEASGVAAVYALVLSVAYGELRIRSLPKVFVDSIVTSSTVMMVIAAAAVGGWLMAVMRLPQAMIEFFVRTARSPWVFLLMVNGILLFLGCITEPTPVLIILGPILIQAASRFGLDPIHMGVVIVLNLMIGLITPPVGTAAFVACGIAKIPVHEFTKEAFPLIIALLVVLGLITYFPSLVTWVPNVLMGQGL